MLTDPKPNQPKGKLALRTLAMPADTNPHGHIFGGWIMSQMDLAGGILAKEISQSRIVTVNASSITFHKPAMVGDVVCCYARCLKTGTTSVTVEIEVWIKKVTDNVNQNQNQNQNQPTNCNNRYRITDAIFTYVAVDNQNIPKALPLQCQQYNAETDDISQLNLSDNE